MLFPKSLLLLCWLTPVHLGVATCLEVLAQANNNAGDGLIMHQACNTVTVMLKADRMTAQTFFEVNTHGCAVVYTFLRPHNLGRSKAVTISYVLTLYIIIQYFATKN